MHEAVRVFIDFGVEKMGLQVIEAGVQKGNAASIRLLEKTGFHQKMDVTDEVYLEFERVSPPK
jgi:RimJ/RimL family protein N-acetyltransferase